MMEQTWNHITQLVSAYVPNLVGAVAPLRELRARFPKTREARLAGPAMLDVE